MDSQGSQQEPHAIEMTLIESLPSSTIQLKEIENVNETEIEDQMIHDKDVKKNNDSSQEQVQNERESKRESKSTSGFIVRSTNPILNELNESIQRIARNDPTLIHLDLKDCPLFSIQHGNLLAEALKTNSHLQELNLQNTQLQTCTAIELSEALKVKTVQLKSLNLEGNAIQPAGVFSILYVYSFIFNIDESLGRDASSQYKFTTNSSRKSKVCNWNRSRTSIIKCYSNQYNFTEICFIHS